MRTRAGLDRDPRRARHRNAIEQSRRPRGDVQGLAGGAFRAAADGVMKATDRSLVEMNPDELEQAGDYG
jgi:hypothetical protein